MHKYLAKRFEKYENQYYNEYSRLHFGVDPKERTYMSTPYSTRISANTQNFTSTHTSNSSTHAGKSYSLDE